MIMQGAPLVFEVQWSAHLDPQDDGVWHTLCKRDNEVDAVIELGREVANNPELPHRIVRTERTELFLVKGVRA